MDVASLVAKELGLRWEAGTFLEQVREQLPADVRFGQFVRATEGMANTWSIVNPPWPRQPWTRVSGLNGECLRRHLDTERQLETDHQLASLRKGPLRTGRLGLVTEDLRRRFEIMLTRSLVDDPFGLPDRADRLESFQIRTRARSRYGPLDDLAGLQVCARVLPLYSTTAVEAAFAVGSRARIEERIHFELIRRASPALAEIPFVRDAWHPALAVQPRAGPEPSSGGANFMASVRHTQSDARLAVAHELAADPHNDGWQVIDRQAFRSKLAAYDTLRAPARRELFGAVTALAWLHPDFLDGDLGEAVLVISGGVERARTDLPEPVTDQGWADVRAGFGDPGSANE